MAPIEDADGQATPPPVPPARYRVAAPGPVTGGVMGVAFANGQALFEDDPQHARALAWFRAEPGYRVDALEQPAPAAESDGPPAPVPPGAGPAEDEPAETGSAPPAARRRK
ncbi:hypothetical protein AB0469_31900 [Streptomyces sp. NPDC093801]|uniref:hypothetical protein n=1 Tax=Streptomyces sp. NPDC093801 TaxID=3155203 RepID=UPI00344E0E2F